MTDKELIKQKIERRLKETNTLIDDTAGTNRGLWLVSNELDEILQFIDSLPEEPASEDKSEKELSETYLAIFDKKYPILPTLKGNQKADFKNFLNKCQQEFGLKEFGIHPTQSKLFEKLTLLWATWGAEHLGGLGESNEYEFDKESISEDLEEAAKQHSKQTFNGILIEDNIDAFKAGAEWQKQQMKEALQTEYEKGRFDIREEIKTAYVVTRSDMHWDEVERVFFDKEKAEEYCKQFNEDENSYHRNITKIEVSL